MNLKNLLKQLKINESTISTLLGIAILIVIGIMAFNYFSDSKSEIEKIEVGNEDLTGNVHTVKQGEDLWKIAQNYYQDGYKWVDIAKENNINEPYVIEVGQKLTIPELGIAEKEDQVIAESKTTIQETSESDTIQTHIVQAGDNLWFLAEVYYKDGFEWEKIAQANNLESPYYIEIGQKLTIPAVAQAMQVLSGNSDTIEGNKYTVKEGDSLWKIALRAYGDGYKWVDIASANSITNPNLIFSGNELNLPR